MKINQSIKLWKKARKSVETILRLGQEGDMVAVIGLNNRRIYVFANGEWIEYKGEIDETRVTTHTTTAGAA